MENSLILIAKCIISEASAVLKCKGYAQEWKFWIFFNSGWKLNEPKIVGTEGLWHVSRSDYRSWTSGDSTPPPLLENNWPK